jgi:hypothetical protein
MYASIFGCMLISIGLQNIKQVGGCCSKVFSRRYVEAGHPSGQAEGNSGSCKMVQLAQVLHLPVLMHDHTPHQVLDLGLTSHSSGKMSYRTSPQVC